jgi:hypothetical protein
VGTKKIVFQLQLNFSEERFAKKMGALNGK